MPILFRIALRNLIEHRGKTLIIGILIALGVVVLIVGNSLMDTARAGISRAFVDNYTGDIMISGTAEGPISLFGVQSVGGIDPTPVLPDYDQVAAEVSQNPAITDWTTQITGFGFLRPEDDRVDGFRNSVLSVMFGAEPESYHEMFDNVRIVEGRYLEPGEEGLMVSSERVEEMEETVLEALQEDNPEIESYDIQAGDALRIVGLSSDGLPRIRVVPLVGIYETTGISDGVGFELVSYVDPQTLRAILKLNLGTDQEVVVDPFQTELLDSAFADDADLDSLFGDDLFSEEPEGEVDFFAIDDPFASSSTDTESVQAEPLAESGETGTAPEDEIADPRFRASTWHYILARVDSPRRVQSTINELNQYFQDNGIDAQAANWEAAAGPFATTADVIRTVFNVAIIVIGIVAVIIMMNTLVISVMERTSEIGTMRALGAGKGFIWKLFVYEILTITTVFGLAGVGLGLGVIGILNVIGIPATNTFLTVLFAGPELKPVASAFTVVASLVIVSIVGLVAHIYPVRVALRIEPIRAIQSE
jgi:putative ABC transport system permease protein